MMANHNNFNFDWLIGAGAIALAISGIWKLVDTIKKRGEREQQIIDALKSLQKHETHQDESIKELDQKVDLLLTEVAIIKDKLNRG